MIKDTEVETIKDHKGGNDKRQTTIKDHEGGNVKIP